MQGIVSIALCCNDPDNGNFLGRVVAMHIGDGLLDLSNNFWPPRGPKLRVSFDEKPYQDGFAARAGHGSIKISHRVFQIFGYRSWWGNWCCDVVLVTPEVAIELVNYIITLDVFQLDGGEVQFSELFERPCVQFCDAPGFEMGMLYEWGYQKP